MAQARPQRILELQAQRILELQAQRILELQDDNTSIRAFLISHGISPSAKIRDNYKKVEKWAATDGGGKVVRYICMGGKL